MASHPDKGEGFGLPQPARGEAEAAQYRSACVEAIETIRERIANDDPDLALPSRLDWWTDKLVELGGEVPAGFLSYGGRTFYAEAGNA